MHGGKKCQIQKIKLRKLIQLRGSAEKEPLAKDILNDIENESTGVLTK